MFIVGIKHISLLLAEDRHTVVQARWGEELAKHGDWSGNLKSVVVPDVETGVQKLAAQAREYFSGHLKNYRLSAADLCFEIGFAEVDEQGQFWPRLPSSYAARYRLSDGQSVRW